LDTSAADTADTSQRWPVDVAHDDVLCVLDVSVLSSSIAELAAADTPQPTAGARRNGWAQDCGRQDPRNVVRAACRIPATDRSASAAPGKPPAIEAIQDESEAERAPGGHPVGAPVDRSNPTGGHYAKPTNKPTCEHS